MEKYTKGNWRAIVVDNHGKPIQSCVVVDTLAGDFIMVADTNRSLPMAECAANARLIASAPEMLEALQIVRITLQQIIKNNPLNIAAKNDLQRIEAAIQKAEGEK